VGYINFHDFLSNRTAVASVATSGVTSVFFPGEKLSHREQVSPVTFMLAAVADSVYKDINRP